MNSFVIATARWCRFAGTTVSGVVRSALTLGAFARQLQHGAARSVTLWQEIT
jgi:hypothetical protein